MRNKLFGVLSLMILASMVLASCAQPTAQIIEKTVEVKVIETKIVEVQGTPQVIEVTPTSPPAMEFKSKDPATYVTANFADSETLDPALDYESAGLTIILNVYDTLITYDFDDPNAFVPNLALEVPNLENGGISADGKTYTFKIRTGVLFHDGSEMTVEDVAYSFQRGLLQGNTSSPQWLFTEAFFGTGIYDIADVVGQKVMGRVEAKADELTAAFDLAAISPETLAPLVTDLAAAYSAESGFTVDAAAGLASEDGLKMIDTLIMTDVVALASDDEKRAAVKSFALDMVAGMNGGDVSALNDDPEAMARVNPEILVEVADLVKATIVADPANNTVTFNLTQPWAPFIPTIAGGWGSVMSKNWVIANGGWDGDSATWQTYYGKTSAQINATPIGSSAMGTGPFILDHWTPGEETVLKANENYWRTEPGWEGGPVGAPKLKTVIIKIVPEFSTRYAMLQAGDADQINVSTAEWPQMDDLTGQVCPNELDTAGCEPTANPDNPLELIKGFPTSSRTDFFFTFKMSTDGGNNFIGSGQLDGNGIPAEFFADEHIRKAFSYCFNYDTYLNDVLFGEAVRSTNVMLPGMIGYDENFPVYTYDPAKCEEEFKLADLDKDGIPAGEEPEDGGDVWNLGFRMTIAYNTGNVNRQILAQIFQQELNALNAKFVIEVTGLPWPTYLQNQRARKLPIFPVGWIEDIHETHNWVQPYTLGTYGNRQNLPAEYKAQFRDIVNRGVVEIDPAKRAAIYAEFNQLFYELNPGLILFVVNGRRYQQRWVEGWFNNPIHPGTYYYSIWKN
jgi:peptide/nickel transport system substrate-binding protein